MPRGPENSMLRWIRGVGLLVAVAGPIAACSPADDSSTPVESARTSSDAATPPSAPAYTAPPVVATVPAPPAPTPLAAQAPPALTLVAAQAPQAPAVSASQAIDASLYDPAAGPEDRRAQLIRIEVLLDRAHFSPGVIDGRDGGNLRSAIAAYEAAHSLSGDGRPDRAVWDALAGADPGPVTTDYVITADDVKGPFIGKTPTLMEAMAKLGRMDYETPLQLLAEKFHMDQKLLAALNPGADFAVAGTTIVVAVPGGGALEGPIARVEVDKGREQVRVLDQVGKAVAVYPATVGSQERPAPNGVWAVSVVVKSPTYTYDPQRLTFGKSKTKLTIPPGPNNPVGSTWIGLTKETYGLHGTSDPTLVGKVASHGCVRLTNWDARQLGLAVRKGTPVEFVGEETHKTT